VVDYWDCFEADPLDFDAEGRAIFSAKKAVFSG
jgi:hypothetical protein